MYGIGGAVGYAPLRKAAITAGDAQGAPGADRHLLLTGDGLRLLYRSRKYRDCRSPSVWLPGDPCTLRNSLLDADAFVTPAPDGCDPVRPSVTACLRRSRYGRFSPWWYRR